MLPACPPAPVLSLALLVEPARSQYASTNPDPVAHPSPSKPISLICTTMSTGMSVKLAKVSLMVRPSWASHTLRLFLGMCAQTSLPMFALRSSCAGPHNVPTKNVSNHVLCLRASTKSEAGTIRHGQATAVA